MVSGPAPVRAGTYQFWPRLRPNANSDSGSDSSPILPPATTKMAGVSGLRLRNPVARNIEDGGWERGLAVLKDKDEYALALHSPYFLQIFPLYF